MTLADEFIRLLHLPVLTAPTLNGVRLALSARKGGIRALFSALLFRKPEERAEYLATTTFLHLPLLETLSTLVQTMDQPSEPEGEIWCLLLDELELMPSPLLLELLDSIRGYNDSRVIFKVSLSPAFPNITGVTHALRAMASHDYEEVKLWYTERTKSFAFTDRLWESFARTKELPVKQAHIVFQHSLTESSRFKDRRVYRQKGFYANIFRTAIDLDPSFKRYINKNKIDIDALEELDDNRRAAIVRKIAPIIPLRLFYRTDSADGPATLRGRKSPIIYAGKEMLFATCDGNPRWFIGIMNKLLDRRNDKGLVTTEVQAEVMQTYAQRYLFKLKTEPLQHMAQGNLPTMSLQSLVSHIGNYLHRRLILDDFSGNPRTSFVVDGDTRQAIARLVELGVAEGVFVYLPNELKGDPLILDDVQDKSFRITYRLAPLFGLSMRNEKGASLSAILRDKHADGTMTNETESLKLF